MEFKSQFFLNPFVRFLTLLTEETLSYFMFSDTTQEPSLIYPHFVPKNKKNEFIRISYLNSFYQNSFC